MHRVVDSIRDNTSVEKKDSFGTREEIEARRQHFREFEDWTRRVPLPPITAEEGVRKVAELMEFFLQLGATIDDIPAKDKLPGIQRMHRLLALGGRH